ncbi:GTP cyclohydrolase II [Kitasatospora sp. NPDC001527]|uniref:GTP cyclohydrolase II n=1 Tax=Kitasatospora sp. NPDC001527 TaxID=3154519 RepID=UPI00331BB27A
MPQVQPPQQQNHSPQAGAARVRARVRIPLVFPDGYRAEAEVFTFHGLADGAEHLALALGTVPENATPLVRLHSECLTGDVFGSARCDCGPQLREAVERIATSGGYLLYLRQEGRGIGLYNKLDAYALQDSGLDTYDANTALGLPEDGRDYTAAAQMLGALGVLDALGTEGTEGVEGTEGIRGIDLLSNNPDKAAQLAALGVPVRRRVPTGVHVSESNVHYLRAKAERTGHSIELSRLVG